MVRGIDTDYVSEMSVARMTSSQWLNGTSEAAVKIYGSAVIINYSCSFGQRYRAQAYLNKSGGAS